MKLSKSYPVLFLFILILAGCKEKPETTETNEEDQLVQKALEIHKRVLTLDTHADTPLRMIEPGFSLADRHVRAEGNGVVGFARAPISTLDEEAIGCDNVR